jgi:hypothetical protein
MQKPFSEHAQNIDRFFTAIKSLNEYDKMEIRGVVAGLLYPPLRDTYFTLNYHRAAINIELVLTLTDTRQFQAIAMLARTIFESAVEIKLITAIPDSVDKIRTFTELEKLRAAKKIVKFKKAHPDAKVLIETYEEFIAKNEESILHERDAMWPGPGKITHWSRMNLAESTELLGKPFNEIYQINYAQLSWYVHSGIVGVANLGATTFALLAGVAFNIAMESYMEILTAIIDEFKIIKADPKLKDKMMLAKMLPFTDTPEEANRLQRAFLGS